MSKLFEYGSLFELEAGGELPSFELAYTAAGKLNKKKDNIVWVCHALTGNADVPAWWGGLAGPGRFFDPERWYIVCANMIGSCYGSTGPLSIDPRTGRPYFHAFPLLTIRDQVRAMILLRKHLGIEHIEVLIGGSMGGQAVLEWAIMEPEIFSTVVPAATCAVQSPWGIAFNEAQRMAIESDSTWKKDIPDSGLEGMKAARAIGMISYRSYNCFELTQTDAERPLSAFRAAGYLKHQGEKIASRFNAYSLHLLSRIMDTHDIGRGRGGVKKALSLIKAFTVSIGVDSDILFPPAEQMLIAANVPHGIYREINSPYGHDAFLIEYDQLTGLMAEYINKNGGI